MKSVLNALSRVKSGVLSLFGMGVVVVCGASAMADSTDYGALVTAVAPDIDTQGLTLASVGQLVTWWVPIAVLGILFFYVRYALKKGKSAPTSGGI